jgi:hypothetical protein
MTSPDKDAAKEIIRLITEALQLAPKAGLYLEIKIREAKK